jgi:hypothetical protein
MTLRLIGVGIVSGMALVVTALLFAFGYVWLNRQLGRTLLLHSPRIFHLIHGWLHLWDRLEDESDEDFKLT